MWNVIGVDLRVQAALRIGSTVFKINPRRPMFVESM